MNILLLGLNSKYIHTNLALYYLKALILQNCDAEFIKRNRLYLKEFSINEHIEAVLEFIVKREIKIVAVSCYIWNIEYVRRLIEIIKEMDREIIIIAGGPESEGDGTILSPGLYKGINEVKNIPDIRELLDMIIFNDFSRTPFPYTKELIESLKNRIIYYESSRGCPYKCSYCLSSIDNRVRYRDIDRVKKELDFFIDNKAELVKFVDRTFNLDVKRTNAVFRHLIDNASSTRFHFEINADIMDDSTIEILREAPPGLFQFEIGIQSTNRKTLDAINRKTDISLLINNIKKLTLLGNIHIHVDLIAGLPYEDRNTFIRSFNSAYSTKPHYFQLGFLKLLKNTPIESDISKYDYRFRDYPPYEIICNRFISQREILVLKGIENLLMKLYNSRRFQNTLEYIGSFFDSPFEMFMKMYEYFSQNEILYVPIKPEGLYKTILECGIFSTDSDFLDKLREKLLLDFMVSRKSKKIPGFLGGSDVVPVKKELHNLIRNEGFRKDFIYEYRDLSVRDILKKISIIKTNHIYKGYILIRYDMQNKPDNNFKHFLFQPLKHDHVI